MQAFADQKVQGSMPSFDVKTFRFLLRSEARVATAILNAKSSIQKGFAIAAALRRAGLNERAKLDNVLGTQVKAKDKQAAAATGKRAQLHSLNVTSRAAR